MRKTLLIDSPYIAFRSMIALKGLSFDDQDTGVIFGFLREIQKLAKLFDYPKFIFAWDSEVKPSYRQEFYPDYKKKKGELDPEMANLLEIGKPQFRELRKDILPIIGFKNQVLQPRLEADDMIAQLVYQYPNWNPVVIVSSDNDLYPLISDQTSIFDIKSKTSITYNAFISRWEIPPEKWNAVKVLAGCDADNIPGIPGIGIKTAIKYLMRELPNGRKLQSIINDTTIVPRNRILIQLPHVETKPIGLVEDNLSEKDFVNICLDFGMRSLIDKEENFKIWRKILE